MDDYPREFQVFFKPAGPACNLACKYCYYTEKSRLYHGKMMQMPDDLLEIYIRQHIEASNGPVITFSWHGGEPMLAGINFYRKALSLQRKYNHANKPVINGLQTNGTMITTEWCEFLAAEKFVVGLSLDGPEDLHNMYRKTKDGKGTFRQVMKGFDRLAMHGIDPEILAVVHAQNAHHPGKVYSFLKHLGIGFITFIPLVERLQNIPHKVSVRSVPADAFGLFLCRIFDEWVREDIGKIKVQIFEEAIRTAFNQEHTVCIFRPVCGSVPVIEHNGNFYSCDHFVDRGHLLGNIRDMHLVELLESQEQRKFGHAKIDLLPEYCRMCEVKAMCNGECPKNRFLSTNGGEGGLNYLCAGYKMFFNHCRPFANAVAAMYET